jgi:hypothetical protein
MVLPFLKPGGVTGDLEFAEVAITGDKLGGDKLSPENKNL